ncbi:MAG: NUDIX domain-containing protein [bacterium]|nr:NUDIX domain-containing protein [bacterium]
MVLEKSAGAIIFYREGNEIYYLLLHYPTQAKRRVGDEGKLQRRQTSSTDPEKEYWGFPKGHIEKKEKLEETAKREVEEETGLKDIKFIDEFKEQEKYFFTENRKKIFKTATYLLSETKIKEIKTSLEHLGFKWLPYEEALEQLTFKNAKEILKKANDHLNQKERPLYLKNKEW